MVYTEFSKKEYKEKLMWRLLGINIIAKLLIQFISMELSKRESEEKPRDLWKEVDAAEYRVKAIINDVTLLNFYNF